MNTDYYQEDGIETGDFDLSQFDESFEEAPVEKREFGDIPDGKYQVSVENAELTKAQTSGNPMLKWTLKILGPSCAGRLMWRNNVISPDTLKWLKTDLHTCGLELSKFSELPSRIHELRGIRLEVTKRTKNESESIYINRLIVMDETSGNADLALAAF
ncbi:MAG: DUF669 domain-containing protein [Armatimonadota bacterium]